jgi:uncharacterized protein
MTATPAMYATSVPVLQQILGGLAAVLAKADAHATAKSIDPNALLQARLFPDMFALVRQVQVACDFAKGAAARLAGVDVPKMDDTETTFAQLQAFISTLTQEQFEAAATREIITQAGTPKEKRFTGQTYLAHYAMPHFYFHVTTAYNLLRHNGVELSKKDFVGSF